MHNQGLTPNWLQISPANYGGYILLNGLNANYENTEENINFLLTCQEAIQNYNNIFYGLQKFMESGSQQLMDFSIDC